ncbi:MAG: hypothetical protein OXC62_13940 [Aestuariivita sp.]|nr:hypothetical protein [Aestuariivita sp.]
MELSLTIAQKEDQALTNVKLQSRKATTIFEANQTDLGYVACFGFVGRRSFLGVTSRFADFSGQLLSEWVYFICLFYRCDGLFLASFSVNWNGEVD